MGGIGTYFHRPSTGKVENAKVSWGDYQSSEKNIKKWRRKISYDAILRKIHKRCLRHTVSHHKVCICDTYMCGKCHRFQNERK